MDVVDPVAMQRATWLALVLLTACGAEGSGTPAGSTTSSAGGSGAASQGGGGSGAAGGGGGTSSTSQGGAAGAGGQGGAYQPDPIPDPGELPPPCPESTPPDYFQFLDDTCGVKQQPSHVDREWACPSADASNVIPLTGGGTVAYQPSSEPPKLDTTALAGLVPSGLTATVILIRRVNGVPHYRYLSTGDHDVAYQPWSTTKWLAAANAAAHLRIESSYQVGLTASVDGYPLGDLVTSVHNYDYDPFSSNGLGRYFHDVGGRDRANGLIHDAWLKRPGGETFGGNYGAAAPGLGHTFKEKGGASVTMVPDTTTGPANHLSSYTIAEALKRVVLHREEAAQRLPGIQWADIKTLLYGAEASAKYGPWGGMTADTAIYLQSGHDIGYLEARSKGRWRIFSKLGLGSGGQFLDVGYACFPVLDPDLQPVPGWGRELVIAAHLPSGGGSWAGRDRLLAEAYRAILVRVVDGRL